MSTTLKDVAGLSGVHPSTVSRVLRGKENIPISETTRQRILNAVKQLNYYPDQTARALRLKKSNVIGLIVPDILNPFFAGIVRSVEIQSYKAGYTLVVCNTDEDQAKEIRFLNDFLSRGVDGLILAPVQDSDLHIRELCEKKFPFVLIDRCFEDFDTNAVICDNVKAAYQATSYLARLGHRRIAFVCGRRNIYTINKRLMGYQKAVTEYHLCNQTDLISGNGFSLQSGYEATMQLLSLADPPTALLISGNIITIGAIKAIVESGLSIPEDISLIGFSDNVLSPYLVCPLTTISHPLQKIGEAAFNLLLKNILTKNQIPYSKIIVETHLDIRKSAISSQ